MYSYPQYIYPPTTVPVQRFFANPHVVTNQYAWGGAPSVTPTLSNPTGVSGVNGGQWMGIGDKIDVGAGKLLGKFGINAGGSPITGLSSGILGGIGSAVGNLGNKAISGGLSSGAGKAISGIGSAVGGLVGKVNPVLGAAVSAASGIIGGLTNRAFGSKLNDEAIAAIKDDVNELNTTRVTDTSNESIANQAMAQNWGGAFDKSTVGKDGWFANKAQREYERLQRGMMSGQNYMAANYANASENVMKNTMNNLLMNTAAYGGFFDNPFSHPGSSAIAYGLEQQNLQNQQQMIGQMQQQNQMQQKPFSMPYACGGKLHCLGGRLFSYGGATNPHGSDFTNGLVYIENGGTHEENPYQGVPMGHDQHGVPNVVEEGEIVVPKKLLGGGSDYVLSNRIPITEEFAEKYHLSPDLSIAQAATKLTQESRENPNDIINETTNSKLMQEMVQMQEQIKQEMQQQQQMRQIAEQQYAQSMGIPQQAMGVPQEQAALQMQEAAEQQAPEIMQPSMAFGGKMFGFGGPKNYFAYTGDIDISKPFVQPNTLMGEIYNRPAGNQPADGYTFGSIWHEYMAPSVLKWAKEHIKPGQSAEERQQALADLNKLQWLYHAAQMPDDPITNKRKSDAIEALQKHAQSMGINELFTEENAQKIFSNHKGQTPDRDPLYVDRENGTQTKSRHAGMAGIYDRQLLDYLRRAGVNAFADDDLDNLYTFENSTDWTPDYKVPTDATIKGILDRDATAMGSESVIAPDSSSGDDSEQATYQERDLLPTWQRMVPLWASGLGVLTDALGLTNKPDYSGASRLEALARQQRGFMPVSYRPIGERMRYNLFDPYQLMLANAANANRVYSTIQDNSNGNGAMANAALLSAGRNAALANGQLALQGQQYNAQNYERALGFNRETSAHNSQGMMSADAQNAHNWRLGQGAYASLIGEGLAYRQREKQAADAARALNLSNFIKGMSNYGKENAYINMVNTNAANQGYGYSDRRFGVDYRSPFFQYPYD